MLDIRYTGNGTKETLKELKARRDLLVRANRKEYSTRGRTARCLELFEEIEKVDAEIEKRSFKRG